MTLTIGQVKEYCKPFLSRRTFKFKQLRPLIGGAKVRDLMLAKAFANPGKDFSNFQAEFDRANPHLYDPIGAEYEKFNAKTSVSHEDRFETSERIRKIFIEHGIFTDFGRPASVGLIINTTEIQGIPTYFLLGESSRQSIFSGRLYPPRGDDPGALIVQVSSAASRVAELLDITFNNNGTGQDHLEKNIARVSKKTLRGWSSQLDFSHDEVPVHLILLSISMRSTVAKLLDIMESARNPQQFLQRAIELQLDSILAHEVAHMEECRANGSITPDKETKEILAYLLEGVYGHPDCAFRAMLQRKCDLDIAVPKLVAHIKEKKAKAFLEDAESLRPFALQALDEMFISITGQTHVGLIRPSEIQSVQTSDHIRTECMPLIERAMCNPSLEGEYKPRED